MAPVRDGGRGIRGGLRVCGHCPQHRDARGRARAPGSCGRAAHHQQPRPVAGHLWRRQRPGGGPVDGMERHRDPNRASARRASGRVRLVAVDLRDQPPRRGTCDWIGVRRPRRRAPARGTAPGASGRRRGDRDHVRWADVCPDRGRATGIRVSVVGVPAVARRPGIAGHERTSRCPSAFADGASALARVRGRQHLHAARVRRPRRIDVLPRALSPVGGCRHTRRRGPRSCSCRSAS